MLPSRQVHLDFHTSEHIPGIGEQFNAEAFAKTVKEAHINSMTVFARCHHGWLYYESKAFPQVVHPHLVCRDLMLQQVRALHSVGVKAPVYITVQWDYLTATTHPEWLIRKPGGLHEGSDFSEAGFYQSLCVNTGYYDYLKEITREVCEVLGDELDGLFFDITGIRPCVCSVCRQKMKEKGMDFADERQVRLFAKETMHVFKEKMSAFVRSLAPNATIFYNSGHVGTAALEDKDSFSHFELESLPSGGWGYLHFPLAARYARKLGKDCLGMTGKFHTSWGDFHSLKNQAALEFESFRTLSYGFGCSIGDQLEPFGRLNPATYRLIGSVYGPYEEREPWGRPSVPLVEAAVLTDEDPATEGQISSTMLGVGQVLEELALQFDVVDGTMDFSPYKLIIVPDRTRVTEDTRKKLDAYAAAGGCLLACDQGGLSEENLFPACYGVSYQGRAPYAPDFLIPCGKLGEGLEQDTEYAIYHQGAHFKGEGAETLLTARAPYFNRTGEHFCSHRYTPSAHGEDYPVAFRKGNVIVFAHPLFTQYSECAPRWVKLLLKNAIDLLLPNKLVRHNGPSTLTVSLLDQPQHNRTCAHILHYVPVRKCAAFDVIEERTPTYNVTFEFSVPRSFTRARLVPENKELEIVDGKICVPEINGYAIVELS